MIDNSDGEEVWFLSILTDGPIGVVLLAVAIVLWIIAASNYSECAKKVCPTGANPRLMEHACLCVMEAK